MPKYEPAVHARDASGLGITLCGARLKEGAVALADTHAEVTCKRCLQWRYSLRTKTGAELAAEPETEPSAKEQRAAWEDFVAQSWEAFRRFRATEEGRNPDVRVKKDDTIFDDWRGHEAWRHAQNLPITFSDWQTRRPEMSDIFARKAAPAEVEPEVVVKCERRQRSATGKSTLHARDPRTPGNASGSRCGFGGGPGYSAKIAATDDEVTCQVCQGIEEEPYVVDEEPQVDEEPPAPGVVHPERVWAYRAYRVVAAGFESRWYADRRDAEWILELLTRPAEQHHEEVELLDGSRWSSVAYWEPEAGDEELSIEEALVEDEPDLDVASGFAMYAERAGC